MYFFSSFGLSMGLHELFIFAIIVAFILLLVVVTFALMTALPPDKIRYESEKWFQNPKSGSRERFPELDDPPSTELTIVVPAYNEELRLPTMMDKTIEHMESRMKEDTSFTYEIIVVDDGSSDKTSEVALKYCAKYGTPKIRVLTLETNRGKGGATRLGMLSGRGKLLLFADADGATRFCDIETLLSHLNSITEDGHGMVCGSRAHLEKESIAKRTLFRTILMKGFHFLVWFLCVRRVKDTQCGFKLFTRDTARLVFSNLHVHRWAFDVDLLYQAEYHRIPIGEVAVVWEEIEGSKLTPFWSWLQMGRDLFFISVRYSLGAWKLTPRLKLK